MDKISAVQLYTGLKKTQRFETIWQLKKLSTNEMF